MRKLILTLIISLLVVFSFTVTYAIKLKTPNIKNIYNNFIKKVERKYKGPKEIEFLKKLNSTIYSILEKRKLNKHQVNLLDDLIKLTNEKLNSLKKSSKNNINKKYKEKYINSIFKGFGIGFGGSSSFPFQSKNKKTIYIESADLILDKNIGSNSYYKNIMNFNSNNFNTLQSKLSNSKFVVYWLTPGWQENWFNINKIQQLIDSGKIPVFSYWYFGDSLNFNIINSKKENDFYKDSIRFGKFLKKIKGTKLILMEPEFNKGLIMSTISNQHYFAKIISKGIDNIKKQNNNIYFSLTMIDKGSRKASEKHCINYKNCSLGDQKSWKNVEVIFNDLKNKLDFISFQEMLSQFSRNYKNPGTWNNPNPIIYSNNDTGINNLEQRIENFTKYLHNKYNKPIFLPYITIMTDTWKDKNLNGKIDTGEIIKNGWQKEANTFYYNFSKRYKILKLKGLFGYAIMQLFDNPLHDINGYKYFLNNESKQGIISTSATSNYPKGDIKNKGDGYIYGSILNNIYSGLNF